MIRKEISNKGLTKTVELFKDFRRVAQSIALGAEFTPITRRKVIPGSNIPRDIRPFLQYLQGGLFEKRIVLTIFNFVNLIVLPPDMDFSNITDGPRGLNDSVKQRFIDFISKAPKGMLPLIPVNIDSRYEDFGYLPASNGPNGQSVRTVHLDTIALVNDPKLFKAVSELLKAHSPMLHENLMRFVELLTPDLLQLPASHSRIAQLCEGGGKTRNIAI